VVEACDAALARYAVIGDEPGASSNVEPWRLVVRGEQRVLIRFRDAAAAMLAR